MVSNGSGLNKAAWVTILLLIGVISIIRFVGLDQVPPGLNTDEAVIAAEAIALVQTGFNSHHEHTLFTPMAAGGYASPTHLYPKALWMWFAGYSIPALRAYAGLEATLLLAGLFFLARSRLGVRAAVYVLLSGCLSPWIFQFSRIAVDDPLLCVGGMVWGMYFFLRSPTIGDGIRAAGCFSVAVYAYSSARVALPLLVPLLLWVKWPDHQATLRYLAGFAVTGLVLCSPIIAGTLQGTLLSRYAEVGLFTPAHVHETSLPAVAGEFLHNFALHLSPKYLFFSGDANYRHSTQFTGEFSWLDTFALITGVALLVSASVRGGGRLPVNRFVLLCLAGFIVGILPSALTTQGLPHSIRGAVCWPFVCLLTGFTMSRAELRWAWALPAFALVAAVFAAGFLRDYFQVYPREARYWFQTNRLDAAEHGQATGDWQPLVWVTPGDPKLAVRYYLIVYAGQSFEESALLFAGPLPAAPANPQVQPQKSPP